MQNYEIHTKIPISHNKKFQTSIKRKIMQFKYLKTFYTRKLGKELASLTFVKVWAWWSQISCKKAEILL